MDFQSGIDRLGSAALLKYEAQYDNAPGIFRRMLPLPGAVEAYQEIAALFETYILSTAPRRNPSAWLHKLWWVNEYLGEAAHKRLILTHHKDLNRGDFLIDDSTKNGAAESSGELLSFGPKGEFKDWPAVLAYLKRDGVKS